jgi:hypothetical protein
VCENVKMRPVETISGMGVGDKRESCRGTLVNIPPIQQ